MRPGVVNGHEANVASGSNGVAVGAVQTHKGLVRDNNEDSYVFDLTRGRFAVIDGMGGQQAGEVAAALVRDSLLGDDQLPRAIHRANQKIYERAAVNEVEQGMGCVVTAVQMTDSRLQIAHVGDTRAYLARENGCRLLTRDHTTTADRQQDLVLSDAVARTLPGQHQVTRDVGGLSHTDDSWIFTGSEPFEPGDLLLLCSDGLHDLVPSDELYGLLRQAKNAGEEPSRLVRRLVQLALERGGKDNVTVLAVRREVPELPEVKVSRPARSSRPLLRSTLGVALLVGGGLIGIAADRYWGQVPFAAEGLVDASRRPTLVAAGDAGLAGELHPATLKVLGDLEAPPGVQRSVIRAPVVGEGSVTVHGMNLHFPAEGRHEWEITVRPGAVLELTQASIRAPNLVLRLVFEGADSRVRILDSHLEIAELIVDGSSAGTLELQGGFVGVAEPAAVLSTTPGPLLVSAPYPAPAPPADGEAAAAESDTTVTDQEANGPAGDGESGATGAPGAAATQNNEEESEGATP